MGKPKVFIARKVPKEVVDFVAEHCEVGQWDSTDAIPLDKLYRELADADGLLTSWTPVDDVMLDAAPKLKVVSNISVGYNNFNVAAMAKRGVIGTNTPEVLDDTVADLVMVLVLAAGRRVTELDRLVREGRWKKGDETYLFGLDVHHRTMGIIGMGRIGEAVARRAKLGFGMEVLYHNRHPKPDVEAALGVRYAELDELLADSDFVVLMTPLTPETTRFFGEAQFKRMKPSAFFINASRGQTVKEDDLIAALQNGTIRGAGLDVFDVEPIDPSNPLLKLDNVVLLPHIGSATAKTRFDMAMLAAKNLIAVLTGQKADHIIPELKHLSPS